MALADLETRIAHLPDAHALDLVRRIGAAHAEEVAQPAVTPEVLDALRAVASPEAGTVTEADLARTALLFFAQDPTAREHLGFMLEQPAARSFDWGTTVAITTAALVILQTHVRFHRNTEGQWTLKIEKKPTSDSLLKALLQKMLTRLGGGT